jgi:hypothetical protein
MALRADASSASISVVPRCGDLLAIARLRCDSTASIKGDRACRIATPSRSMWVTLIDAAMAPKVDHDSTSSGTMKSSEISAAFERKRRPRNRRTPIAQIPCYWKNSKNAWPDVVVREWSPALDTAVGVVAARAMVTSCPAAGTADACPRNAGIAGIVSAFAAGARAGSGFSDSCVRPRSPCRRWAGCPGPPA